MRVSVVIPTHNRCHLLPRAIGSVLTQSHPDLELLVVDDASTDGTPELVGSYLDSRIQLVRLSENAGACAARNEGLRVARGDAVAFLDSDDWWHPRKLEAQLDLVERGYAALSTVTIVGGRQPATWTPQPSRVEQSHILGLFDWKAGCGSSIIADIDAARRTSFDLNLTAKQDWDFLLRLSAIRPVLVAPESEVFVNKHRETKIWNSENALEAYRLAWQKHRTLFNNDDEATLNYLSMWQYEALNARNKLHLRTIQELTPVGSVLPTVQGRLPPGDEGRGRLRPAVRTLRKVWRRTRSSGSQG